MGKKNVQEYRNYSGIKLMSHGMKIWEKIIHKRVRSETFFRRNQFGFMPRRSKIEPIFCNKKLVEIYIKKRGKCVWNLLLQRRRMINPQINFEIGGNENKVNKNARKCN